ncbi:MAG: hypothetical protein C0395_09000 [Gemmatimonas sp.]|nr:hypothetical protein [Gemmatimonas sp.]
MTLTAVALLAALPASALDVDPGLRAALAAKADGGTVPVLVLLPGDAGLESLVPSLEGLTPSARRAAVIAALRDRAATAEAPVRAALRAAAAAGRVEKVRSLYVANALLFEADAAAVAVLAADKSAGAMRHDRGYDLISSVMDSRVADAPAPTGGSPLLANVWSIGWINADDVWALGYHGDGIVVGHIDSGVWLAHPDIANRLWTNPGEIAGNALDDDANGYVDDVHGYDFGDLDGDPNDDSASPGHGTHTAGTVAGDGAGGTATGVAPGAQIMACKAFAADGSGTLGMIWQSYQYILENGARLITMSLGVPGDLDPSLMRAERETCNIMRTAGITIFNSSGNDHAAYDPPIECGLTARVPAPWNAIDGTRYSSTGGVVAVGGTGFMSNAGYTSSSWGPVKWDNVDPWNDWPYNPGVGLLKPDVSAPAVNVNSLVPPSGYSGNTWSGTSMACPHVAGVAALMLQKNPTLSPAGLDSILELSSLDLGSVGKDNQFGAGRVDALAAVNMVPATQAPQLSWSSFEILDATADGVIDPGEAFDVVFTLNNTSALVAATSVAGGLAVVAGGPATVTEGAAVFGAIAANGGTATNAADVFSLVAAPGAAQGATFTMLLTVTAQDGYEVTFDAEYFVGLPEWRTHDAGNVLATVTDTGSLGYTFATQAEGHGFGPAGANGLYVGSFWGGATVSYVCNHDYAEGATSYDWQTVTTPNGRMADLGTVFADQHYQAIFKDSGNLVPRNITVTQESFAFADAPNDDFVILRYTVRNNAATTLSGYYTGIFCDFDINDSSLNRGAVDATRRLTYMYPDGGGYYYGIALREPTTAKNLTLISNPTQVYPNGFISDTTKFRLLNATISTPTTSTANDWSALTSAGPVTIPSGAEAVYLYALVWGESLADLQANTDAALAVDLTGSTPVADAGLPRALSLAQNSPNPFNPQTTIVFALDRAAGVRLGVYDLQGRLVRTLAERVYAPGEHSVVWDGRDESGAEMPSGLYLYRLEDGRRTQTRKMVLVR